MEKQKKSKVKFINIDMKVEGLNNNERMVYSHIKSLCKGVKPYCFARNNSLATTLNISERTLYRILARLESRNLIKRTTNSIGHYGKERTIRVHSPSANMADI